jgi:DNA invertase Pin-like site-specific DNA recombinase
MIELRRAIDPNHWFVPRRRRPLRPARQLQRLQLVAGASWRRGGDRKGKQNTPPQLAHALTICRGHLLTLLIAKLDRLARNVHFISGLMETGVPFVAADMPTATLFMLHIYAAMAEAEGIAISTRTKAALTAAKARGVKLGNPWLLPGSPDQARMAAAAKSGKATARATDLLPVIAEVRAAGVATLSGIAKALTARGVPTPSGRGAWSPATVLRLDRRVQVA